MYSPVLLWSSKTCFLNLSFALFFIFPEHFGIYHPNFLNQLFLALSSLKFATFSSFKIKRFLLRTEPITSLILFPSCHFLQFICFQSIFMMIEMSLCRFAHFISLMICQVFRTILNHSVFAQGLEYLLGFELMIFQFFAAQDWS